MPELAPSQIADLVTLTLNNYITKKWTGLVFDQQNFFWLPMLMRNEYIKYIDAGADIDFKLKVRHSGAARHVGLFGEDSVPITDTMISGTVPIRFTETSWGYDVREKEFQRGANTIVDLVETREVDAMESLAELTEISGFGKPDDSTDLKTPYGLKMWVVKNATKGFYGGNPAGFSSGVAGISSVTYPRFRNWSGTYSAISKADFVTNIREAATKCNFKGPVPHPEPVLGPDERRYITNYTLLSAMETMLENQNDSLGNDVASKDGLVLFRKRPVEWCSYLDNDTTNPFYGINFKWFQCYVVRGEQLRRTGPVMSRNNHNVFNVFVDLSHNWVCTNRREQFVIYQA